MKQSIKDTIFIGAVIATCAIIVIISGLSIIMPLREQIKTDEIKLVILQSEIDFYRQFTNETLRNPSYSELSSFLQNDSTDNHSYIKDTYVCLDFSYALIRNATIHGFLCGYASVAYGIFSTGHAMVTFDTTDRGLVFIEPQNDEMHKLSTGDKYNSGVIEEITLIERGEK